MKSIYVAATGQHVGKTTSTLGLVATLRKNGYNVGYCKPVGQQHVEVNGSIADKDAVLFADMLKMDLIPKMHSPVILGRGVTSEYLTNPELFNFKEQLDTAKTLLEKEHELIIYEGTGHPGVGSVVGASNAEVAKHLQASVVMVAEGGIGSTIDKVNMSLALFREHNVPVVGLIINKVLPEKLEKVRELTSKWFGERGIPVIGVLPYDKQLSYPIMDSICRAVKGRVLYHDDKMTNRVEGILAGSLVDTEEIYGQQQSLLVVSQKRLGEAIAKVEAISEKYQLEESPLSGIIVTGDGRHAHLYDQSDINDNYILEHELPVITTTLDTLGSVTKISRIEVKINTRTPWKVLRAIELFRRNVDLQAIGL